MAGRGGKTPWPAIAVGGSSRVNDAFPSGCMDRFHTGDGGVSYNLLHGKNNATIHRYDDVQPNLHLIISRLQKWGSHDLNPEEQHELGDIIWGSYRLGKFTK
ncbi:unnamed protein product [Spirodela intermedia]|uniref:Uncharacterized protein n=1 Tax=Spirodela intermedia TaxID=51605 RepID=A0A7I8LF44_SPIIN|nr:unnamed protein product [Spirodela intermedia]